MSSFSSSDLEALTRVVGALRNNADLIHSPELLPLKQWVESLGAQLPSQATAPPTTTTEEQSEEDDERWTLEAEPAVEIPSLEGEPSDESVEKAMELKGEAMSLASDNKYDESIAKMSDALRLTPNNAMYWGLRSLYYLKNSRPNAALHDANRALAINPQNVRALRVRGTVNRHLGRWEDALKDLSAAQAVDYDDNINEIMRFVQNRLNARHQRELRKKQQEEENQRKREEERRRPQQSTGPAPSAPGGMPGVPPQMAELLQDPEILAAMQDPEVAPKLTQLMSNPAAAMSMMNDPKVGPLMQKIMSKMMGGGAGGGGMPSFPFPGGAPAPDEGGVGRSDDLD